MKFITEAEIETKARDYIAASGGASAVAADLNVSPQFISRVKTGQKKPNPQLLDRMGYEKRIVYIPKGK